MEHPKDVGDRSTLAIMLALRERGYGVYVPFGENTRSDLIIETESTVLRVQCKTGRLRNGSVEFATCSSYRHHRTPKPKRSYVGEVDVFAVYCRDLGTVYLVPISGLPANQAMLRVDPPRNNQVRRIRLATAYEIARVELTATPAPAAPAGAGGSCA
jgi:PD-(D/E)XK endonuclease